MAVVGGLFIRCVYQTVCKNHMCIVLHIHIDINTCKDILWYAKIWFGIADGTEEVLKSLLYIFLCFLSCCSIFFPIHNLQLITSYCCSSHLQICCTVCPLQSSFYTIDYFIIPHLCQLWLWFFCALELFLCLRNFFPPINARWSDL